MATAAELPVNGGYSQPGYEAANYSTTGSNSASAYSTSQQTPQASSTAASEIPKDEVGWYFVEQYYTTLSRSPDKLYLFYNKRSQFVSGNEEDKVPVCVGQKAINDRIKELDFHDTKVRVTNVDSQGSDANIVIQVIGEISNKGQPHKRFAQTFVLAEQTNGYFVLNDIFRYLAEEPEEEELSQEAAAPATGVVEPAPTVAEPQNASLNASEEIATSEEDLSKVDHKLEETAQEEPAREASPPPAAVNGTPVPENAEVAEADEAPAAAVAATEEAPSKESEAPVEEPALEPEKPKDPAPTPAPKAAAPAAPAKPAVPKSWAALAASAHKVATPVVPAPASSQAPSQPKSTTAAAPTQQPLAVPAQTSAPAREPSPANSQGDAAGWQTAGTKKEQLRQGQAPSDGAPRQAYIKNVYSQVDDASLKSTLAKFGEIESFDINRTKSCAFVDFKTPAGFQAAVAANPHTVKDVELKVEERKVRPQGNFGGRGGGFHGRGGFPRGGRGGFSRGNRGSGSISRGRGGAPQES